MSIRISLGVPEVKALLADNAELELEIAKGATAILTAGLVGQVKAQIEVEFRRVVVDLIRRDIAALVADWTKPNPARPYSDKVLSDQIRELVQRESREEAKKATDQIQAEAREHATAKVAEFIPVIEGSINRRITAAFENEINNRVNLRLAAAIKAEKTLAGCQFSPDILSQIS